MFGVCCKDGFGEILIRQKRAAMAPQDLRVCIDLGRIVDVGNKPVSKNVPAHIREVVGGVQKDCWVLGLIRKYGLLTYVVKRLECPPETGELANRKPDVFVRLSCRVLPQLVCVSEEHGAVFQRPERRA